MAEASKRELLMDEHELSKKDICDAEETNVFNEDGLSDMTTEPLLLNPPGNK